MRKFFCYLRKGYLALLGEAYFANKRVATGGLIKGSKDLIKGLRTGASTVVKEGGEYVIRKTVVSNLDEIRNIAKIMDDFPNLRALGDNAESLAEKLLKASDGNTQILSRLNSLPDKAIETFAKDFSQADDILAKFAKDPDLVKAWEALQNTSFRTEIKWLESVDVLKKNDLLKYVNDISDAEAAAIYRYTVNNFELTKGAYTSVLTTKQQEWLDLVNSGLDKLRRTKGYQGKVFRGSNRPESEIIEKYVNVYNEGVARGITPRVNEPPLLSTSKSADVAEDFVQRFKSPDNVEVLFEITSKKGVDIDDISDYGKNLGPKHHPNRLVQKEVILSNNQDYEILEVIKSTNTDGSIKYLIKLSE